MILKALQVGEIGTNCYIAGDEDTKLCAVIDPGDDAAGILRTIEGLGLTMGAIFLTHGHFDHTMAVPDLRAAHPEVPVYIHKEDCGTSRGQFSLQFDPSEGCRFYSDGDIIEVGGLKFTVLHTPGHSPGCVTLQAGDCLFTGDTLFEGSCGRTDLGGGSYAVLMQSLRRLGELAGDFRVLPGHMGASTLERERRGNYYLREAMGG